MVRRTLYPFCMQKREIKFTCRLYISSEKGYNLDIY